MLRSRVSALYKTLQWCYAAVAVGMAILAGNSSAEEGKKTYSFEPLMNLEETMEFLSDQRWMKRGERGFIPTAFEQSLYVDEPATRDYLADKGVMVMQNNFEVFCDTHPTASEEKPSIPPVVHMIWLGSTPPRKVFLAMNSWRRHHPTWEIRLWTDGDVETFSWSSERSRSHFENADNWSEKSDIWRFEILYQHGGVYSDTDVLCLNGFDALINSGLEFFAGLERSVIPKGFTVPQLGSAIIGARRHSPIMQQCLYYSQTRTEAPTEPQHFRSGPGPLSKACYDAVMAPDNQKILILPCSYFYSLPWRARKKPPQAIADYVRPESLAIHLWEGSWFHPGVFDNCPLFK